MKFIHITDTHLVAPGARLYGLDPRSRLDAAVADINRNHADAVVAIVTGDLTHWGEPAAYRSFADSLAKLAVPHVAMVGNHDRRVACLEGLQHAPRSGDGFVQGTRDTPDGTLIFLDTLDETSHAGELCSHRLGWLERTLAGLPADRSIFVFMHHPPFSVGIHAMDEISLRQRAEFTGIISPYAVRIRQLFFGHVHRPMSGSWHGIPFSTLRGTNHQVWFDLNPAGEHLASHEPPAYGVVLVGAETVVVHTHDFLDRSLRFPFSKPGLDDRAYVLGDFPS